MKSTYKLKADEQQRREYFRRRSIFYKMGHRADKYYTTDLVKWKKV